MPGYFQRTGGAVFGAGMVEIVRAMTVDLTADMRKFPFILNFVMQDSITYFKAARESKR